MACDPGHCPLCDDARRLERNASATGPACLVLIGTIECPPDLFPVLRQYAEVIAATGAVGKHDHIYHVRLTERDWQEHLRPLQRSGRLLARLRPETPKERKARRYAESEAEATRREYDLQDEAELDKYRRHPKRRG